MPAAKTTMKKPAQKTAKKVTLDDVWATMRELQEIQKETEKAIKETQKAHKETEKTLNELGLSHQETEKAIKETQKAHQETEKAIKETQKAHQETEKTLNELGLSHQETEKAIKETQKAHKETEKTLNRAIDGIGNTLGSLVEHIMTPGLPRKFRELGFTFDRITNVRWAVEGSIYTEIDGLLENGDQAMVVEVKTTLRQNDIDNHVKRMEKVRKYADDHGDKRKFLGAIAATITDESAKNYALKKGFFVIEPSGEDVKITQPFSEPKVW